jgi:amidase
MTIRTPNLMELAAIAERFRLQLDTADLESFQGLISASLASYEVVDDLTSSPPASAYPRTSGHRPSSADNPLGAWYWRGSIQGALDGPLAGKTVVIKDNTTVAGMPMMNGSRTLAGFVPSEDATVVTRLLDAGAEVVGKAVSEDLCFSGGSHTPATGPVRNPWDPSRSAGGSSGGSAALLAAGEVDLALGGDQGGSVRIPASFCGVVGLKPTHGLVPYTGAFPIETTIDHLGPLGKTVGDVALMLSAIAGPDGRDPRQDRSIVPADYLTEIDAGIQGMRVGIVKEGFNWPGLSDSAVDAQVESAARRLVEVGAEVVDVSIPQHRDGIHVWNVISIEGATTQMVNLNGGMNYKGRYDPSLMAAFHAGRLAHATDLSQTVQLVALMGQFLIDEYGGTYYAKAQNLAPMLTAAYDAVLADVDVLIMPTLPLTATELPGPDASREDVVARALEMIPNTCAFNVTGHPALSVPAGPVNGLPTGMMIVGRHFDEATVLRVGRAFESLVGGFPLAPSRVKDVEPTGTLG